jgi:hypothetical protein
MLDEYTGSLDGPSGYNASRIHELQAEVSRLRSALSALQAEHETLKANYAAEKHRSDSFERELNRLQSAVRAVVTEMRDVGGDESEDWHYDAGWASKRKLARSVADRLDAVSPPQAETVGCAECLPWQLCKSCLAKSSGGRHASG